MRVEEMDVAGKVTKTIDFGLFYYEDEIKMSSARRFTKNGIYAMKIFQANSIPTIMDKSHLLVLNSSFTISISKSFK